MYNVSFFQGSKKDTTLENNYSKHKSDGRVGGIVLGSFGPSVDISSSLDTLVKEDSFTSVTNDKGANGSAHTRVTLAELVENNYEVDTDYIKDFPVGNYIITNPNYEVGSATHPVTNFHTSKNAIENEYETIENEYETIENVYVTSETENKTDEQNNHHHENTLEIFQVM